MPRCTIPFGVAVDAMGLKFIRQFVVSMPIRRAALLLAVAGTIIGQRFDESRLKTSPPNPLYIGCALINDNFCDFIGGVAVAVVLFVDVMVVLVDTASVKAAAAAAAVVSATMPLLLSIRLICVDMPCIALVLF